MVAYKHCGLTSNQLMVKSVHLGTHGDVHTPARQVPQCGRYYRWPYLNLIHGLDQGDKQVSFG